MIHTTACWAAPVCTVCGLRKKPIGRDASPAMANSLCDHECPGYRLGEQPGHFWPNEPDPDTAERGAL